MSKKFTLIPNVSHEPFYTIVSTEEIENKVYTDDALVLVGVEATEENVKWLNDNLRNYISYDEEQEAMMLGKFPKSELKYRKWSQKGFGYIILSNGEWFALDDCDETRVFFYWDGSNQREITIEPDDTAEDLEVTDDNVNFDEWDGNNHVTGGQFNHAQAYKVLGEEDKYLLYTYDQFQGTLPLGQTMTLEELLQWVKEVDSLDRDLEDYREQLLKLGGSEDDN